jgi:GTP-binding protein Era
VCLLVDATAPIGRGDQWVAERVPADAIIVVNKTDLAPPNDSAPPSSRAAAEQLAGGDEYFPVSARPAPACPSWSTRSRPAARGPGKYYPDDMVTDVEEAFWVAELVREQLLAVTRDEVPHSVATRVTEWDWPRIRVEILVERDSQKGIVIGKKGACSSRSGIAVRRSCRRAPTSSCSSRSTRTGSAVPRPSSASATEEASR